jgi:hypothetical protein
MLKFLYTKSVTLKSDAKNDVKELREVELNVLSYIADVGKSVTGLFVSRLCISI